MPGMPLQSGKLRKQIELQSVSESPNTFGEPVQTWSTAATVRASIEPLSGREAWIAQQANQQTTHKIVIRYYSGLTAKYRIKYGSRYFQIDSIRDVEELSRTMEIMATESA